MKKKIARSFRFMGTAVKELFGSSESMRNASTIFLIQFSLFFLCYPLSFRADDGPMNAVRLVMIALIGIALPYIGYTARAKFDAAYGRRSGGAFRFFLGIVAILSGPVYLLPRIFRYGFDLLLPALGLPAANILFSILFAVVLIGVSYLILAKAGRGLYRAAGWLTAGFCGLLILFLAATASSAGSMLDISAFDTGTPALRTGYDYSFVQISLLVSPFVTGWCLGEGQSRPKPAEEDQYRFWKQLAFVGPVVSAVLILLFWLLTPHAEPAANLSMFETACLAAAGGNAVQKVLLGLTVLAACAVSCVTLASAAAKTLFGSRGTKYGPAAVPGLMLIVAAVIALAGGARYFSFTAPLMLATFPPAACMTLYAIWVSDVSGVRAVHGFRIAMWATVLFALLTAAYQYNQLFGFGGEALPAFYNSFILSGSHMTWLAGAVLFYAIGDISYKKSLDRQQRREQKQKKRLQKGK